MPANSSRSPRAASTPRPAPSLGSRRRFDAARQTGLALALGACFLSSHASADTYAYTGGGTGTVAVPVTGNFTNGFNDITTPATGVTPASAASTALTFGGTTYTATNNIVGLILDALTFTNTSTVTVATTGGGSLVQGAATTITLNNSGGLTIADTINNGGFLTTVAGTGAGTTTLSGIISGAGGLTKNSTGGTLNLSAVNTYTGGTNVNAGSISPSSGTSLGTGAVNLGATGSGTAANIIFGTSNTTLGNAITVNSGGTRTIYTSGGGSFNLSGPITLANGASLGLGSNGGGAETVSGGVTGTGNLGLGSPQAGRTASITVSGGALNNVGFITDKINATTASGGLGYGGDQNGTTTISAQIGSNVTELYAISATNNLVLSGAANPFFGDTVVSGKLQLENATTLQNSVVNLNTGSVVVLGTSATVGLPAVTLGGLAGTANLALNDTKTAPGAVALTLGNSNVSNGSVGNPNTLNPVYSGVLSDGTATGASVTKVDTNTQTFSGANTYTGGTTVNGGTLTAGVAENAGGTAGAFGFNSAVTLANTNGATLNLNGNNETIGSLTGGGTTGGNVTLGAGTLTLGTDNTSPAAYGGVISGTGGLTKVGTGTETLTGANTYSGGTAVNAGTLALNAAGADGTGAATIASGATVTLNTTTTGAGTGSALGGGGVTISGGTLANTKLNGTAATADPTTSNDYQNGGLLTLTNGTTSIIDFGAGNTGAVFSFTGLSGTGSLNVLNFNGNFFDGTNGGDGLDQLLFENGANNNTPVLLSAAQLAQITFIHPDGDAGNSTAKQLADGEVSPAPEPSQVGMMGLMAFGLGGLILRAKKRQAATGETAA